jgi:hypothetical protein
LLGALVGAAGLTILVGSRRYLAYSGQSCD